MYNLLLTKVARPRFISWEACFSFLARRKEGLIIQSCLTLCDPMDWGLPGSSVHGILQARILEWVAVSFSRRSSQPRDLTQVSCTAGRLSHLSHKGVLWLEVYSNSNRSWCQSYAHRYSSSWLKHILIIFIFSPLESIEY